MPGMSMGRGMGTCEGSAFFLLLWCFLVALQSHGREVPYDAPRDTHHYVFNIQEARFSRLCQSKSIMTVNGEFPGPTLYARKGDTLIVDVINHAEHNITIHWHGVKQRRNPWSDGPAYVTQCPIIPGGCFSQTISLSTEEGTLWWHAHNDWTRATVHGAIVVFPTSCTAYPFPPPYSEQVLVLGEWWKEDIDQVLEDMSRTGGTPRVSDAYTINGQPGDFYPCSRQGTFNMNVERGMTYLLRIINAVMNDDIFFSVAGHRLTVVGSDGNYLKPFPTNYLLITPGETFDVLLFADQYPGRIYYMAARAYDSSHGKLEFDGTTTTATLTYTNGVRLLASTPPLLPDHNDTAAAFTFAARLHGMDGGGADATRVPREVTEKMFVTVSVNELPCVSRIGGPCRGPNGTRLAASVNNVSFVTPSIDILQAYYRNIRGVYENNLPSEPPLLFDFTAEDLPRSLLLPEMGTQVKVFEYGAAVEIVVQGTNLAAALTHPMHLHGYDFYVVGMGFGNFQPRRDPSGFNLVDPPKKNTIGVPRNGWVAVRFKATNPGVWLWHCHFERHVTWGMMAVFVVKDGKRPEEKMLPPPQYMPPC